MEILALLDKLESTVQSSGKIPATKKVVIDGDRLLDLIDQIRLAIPKSVQEADEILMKRESVVNQALLEARRMKSEADVESRKRIDTNEVVKEANKKAEEIVSEAKRRGDMMVQDAQRKAHQITGEAEQFADGRIQEASHYAQETLLSMEKQLSTTLNTIRRGLDSLEAPAPMSASRNGNRSATNGKPQHEMVAER
ncbi:MAG: hypothetical protein EXR67_03330 [Dehalococcoidia bacterium]|nr:hypothetical protein [Dehalococcoidia bacterium]